MNNTNIMQVRAHRGNYALALSIFILLAFGLIMMYNISPALAGTGRGSAYFRNQLLYVVLGVAAWATTGAIYYKVWERFAVPFLALSLIATLAVLVPHLGYTALGASRWLHVGPFSFQPAELLKLGLVIYLASWFHKRTRDEIGSMTNAVVPFMVMLGAIGVLIAVIQRDLGTMLVIAGAAFGMFYLAGLRMQHLAILLAGSVGLAWLAIISFPHRLSRFTTFLDPMRDCNGGGYHICQSLIGIGSGGLFGVGLGKSIQIYGYLPEAPNDSIFAVIGEEFGLIGSLILIGLFGLLIYHGFQITRRAPDTFARLAAGGITMIFLFQAFINIGAMLSVVPLTGIPLPFVSYGGSSLIIMMAAAGILFNISKYTLKEVAHADSRQWRGDSRPRLAGSSNRRRVAGTR